MSFKEVRGILFLIRILKHVPLLLSGNKFCFIVDHNVSRNLNLCEFFHTFLFLRTYNFKYHLHYCTHRKSWFMRVKKKQMDYRKTMLVFKVFLD